MPTSPPWRALPGVLQYGTELHIIFMPADLPDLLQLSDSQACRPDKAG